MATESMACKADDRHRHSDYAPLQTIATADEYRVNLRRETTNGHRAPKNQAVPYLREGRPSEHPPLVLRQGKRSALRPVQQWWVFLEPV